MVFQSPATRIAALYTLFGAAWILLSDRLVAAFVPEPLNPLVQSLKGFLFILVTAALVYLLAFDAHRRLRQRERTYRELFEASPDALFLVARDGTIRDANRVAVEQYGYARDELLRMRIAELSEPEKCRPVQGRLMDAFRGPVAFSWRHVTRDGKRLDVAVHAQPIQLEDETFVLSAVRDVSEERETARRFQTFVESADDLVYALTPDGTFTYLSPAWESMMDEPPEAAVGKSFVPYVHPDDVPVCTAFLERVLDTRQRQRSVEYRVIRPDGEARWHMSTGSPLYDAEGAIAGYVGIARDTTERHTMQEALRASEARYRTLVEEAPVGIFTTSSDGRALSVNPRMAQLLDCPTPEDAIRHYTDLSNQLYVRPERRAEFLAELQAHDGVDNFEYEARTASGRVVWLSMTARVARRLEDGSFVIEGFASDISARRQAQEARHELEARYRTVVENFPNGAVFLFDRECRHLFAGGPALTEAGIAPESLLGKPLEACWPEDAARDVRSVCEAAFEHGTASGEGAFAGRVYANHAAVVRRGKGAPRHVVVLAFDITARKQAEEALAASERRYRGVFENAHDAFLVFARDGRIVDANPRAWELYGYTRDEFLKLSSRDTVHPDYYHVFEAFARQLQQTGTFHGESRDVRKDGTVFDIEVRGAEIVTEEGPRLLAFIRDITESKRSREALEASEQRYRTYVDNSPAAIFIVDADGRYIDVNRTACSLLGYSREELLAMDIDAIIEVPGSSVAEAFTTLKEEGRLREQLDLLGVDGRRVHAAVDAVALGDGRYMGFCVDIGERLAAEARVAHLNAVLRSLRHVERLITAERDRSRLVQGVCDGLVEARGFHNAWAILLNSEGLPGELAAAGADEDAVQLRTDIAEGRLPACVEQAMQRSGPVLVEDPISLCEHCTRSHRYERWSAMAVRLESDGRVYGVLVVSVAKHMAGDAEEQALFLELAQDIGFALRSLETEQERRAHEEQRRLFERIVSAASVPMAFLDTDLCYRAVNDEYEYRFGRPRTEILGCHPSELMEPDFVTERVEPRLRRCLAGEEISYEVWVTFPAVGHRCMVMQYHPYRDGGGEVTGIIAVGLDVTDVRDAERALRQSEAELLAFFNSTEDAIYLKDTRFRYVRVNHALETFFGLPAAEIVGKDDFDLFPREEAEEIRRVDQHLLEGETIRGDYVRHVDGRERHVETVRSPVRDIAGRVVGLCGVSRDVTERKHLEEQLRQAQKMEAVGQLAGGVAHDFNNLLQVINGHTDLMLVTTPKESELHGDLQEVAKAGERAARLVGQLLAFSRRQVMQPIDLNLNDVVADLMKMLGRLIGEDVRLEFVPGHRLGTVHADRGMMEQVLMNLCVNARDAMPEGGSLVIETENVFIDTEYCAAHAWARPGRFVMMSISDSGCGMDEGTLDRVFEPFFTTKGPGKGTGLGLATVYGIVRQHEGSIQVYSEVDTGTTFKVYLPVSERAARDVGDKVEAAAAGGTETILLAEDDPMVSNLAKRTLERAGYRVLTAPDGEEAIETFKAHAEAIDLCMFDVVMPRLSGREAYEQIRAIRHVPVLYASGYSENAVHTNFILHEDVELLQKPFSRDALLRAVRRVLDQPSGAGGAPPGD